MNKSWVQRVSLSCSKKKRLFGSYTIPGFIFAVSRFGIMKIVHYGNAHMYPPSSLERYWEPDTCRYSTRLGTQEKMLRSIGCFRRYYFSIYKMCGENAIIHTSKVVSTHLWNTPPKPLPTGYTGIPFIVGQGDCLGCALGVCCNFLGIQRCLWLSCFGTSRVFQLNSLGVKE